MKRSPIRGGELCMMLRYWILAPESSGILMIWYVPSFTTLLHSLRSQAAMWITLKKRSFVCEWLVAGLWNGLRLCCENSVVQFWFKTVWFLHLDTTYGPPYVPCKLICFYVWGLGITGWCSLEKTMGGPIIRTTVSECNKGCRFWFMGCTNAQKSAGAAVPVILIAS